jgi:Tol biopolymer transport system component
MPTMSCARSLTSHAAFIASDGSQEFTSNVASISANGRYVAFSSDASNLVGGDTNGYTDVFVRDRQTGFTQRVSLASNGSQGTGHSYNRSISANGRFVAFDSYASNLVGEDTNDTADAFVRDRGTGSYRSIFLPLTLNEP